MITIILAVIGMIGLFSTAVIYQRSNRITSRYYLRNDSTSFRSVLANTTSKMQVFSGVHMMTQSMCMIHQLKT